MKPFDSPPSSPPVICRKMTIHVTPLNPSKNVHAAVLASNPPASIQVSRISHNTIGAPAASPNTLSWTLRTHTLGLYAAATVLGALSTRSKKHEAKPEERQARTTAKSPRA